MIDKNLLKLAKESLHKEAYVPMTPEAMAAAQQPPPPPPGEGPNAGAGAPPPMDPAAAGAAPMDPAAAGGMPAGAPPPMDPAMMAAVMGGGAGAPPPADPNAVPPPSPGPDSSGGQPVMLNLKDLQELFKQVNEDGNDEADAANATGTPESSSKRITNKMISDKIDDLNQTLGMIGQALGIQPPVQQTGVSAGQSAMPSNPEDIQAALSGMSAGGAAPQGAPKMASMRSKDKLTRMIERLKSK